MTTATIGAKIAPEDVLGVCHICKWNAPVRYCSVCDHWFCGSCRKAYFRRGYEFVMQLVKGKHPGCCGPKEAA